MGGRHRSVCSCRAGRPSTCPRAAIRTARPANRRERRCLSRGGSGSARRRRCLSRGGSGSARRRRCLSRGGSGSARRRRSALATNTRHRRCLKAAGAQGGVAPCSSQRPSRTCATALRQLKTEKRRAINTVGTQRKALGGSRRQGVGRQWTTRAAWLGTTSTIFFEEHGHKRTLDRILRRIELR